jgi:phosphopantothenoylcysteine decarboxylase/phosphopantothenate--cysteine ligase
MNKINKKTILVTAGGTREMIDSVRYIGNNSTGKMGYCIAEELASNGARVILISGKTHLTTENPNIQCIDVISAEEMYDEAMKWFPTCEVAICTAAVADFKPANIFNKKIKKDDTNFNMTIPLVPTKDILANLGKIKDVDQYLVGFALETDNELENAKKKLKNKNLDFIVLNSLNDKGAGFETSTNKITIIDKSNNIQECGLKSKDDVAKDIISKLINII